MNFENIRLETRGRVGLITLDRQENRGRQDRAELRDFERTMALTLVGLLCLYTGFIAALFG